MLKIIHRNTSVKCGKITFMINKMEPRYMDQTALKKLDKITYMTDNHKKNNKMTYNTFKYSI